MTTEALQHELDKLSELRKTLTEVQETLKEVLDSVAIVHYFVVNGDCGCG